MKKQILLVISALTLVSSSAMAQQPGSLDATFNGKGIKNFAFVTNTEEANVTASFLQPDGKLLVAYLSTNGTNYTSFVSRFLSDGKEDVSFGNGGKKIIDINFGGAYFIANAIALQNDGSIILAGLIRGGDGDYGCVIKLKADGIVDTQFGLDGAASISGDHGEVFLTVQVHKTTGNIYASGGRPYVDETETNSSFFTTCFSSTGQIVSAFGGGTVYTSFYDTPFDVASSSVIKGNVLYVAGTVRDNGAPQRKHFGLLAINTANGTLVRDFFFEQIEDWETSGKLRLPLAVDAPDADNVCTAMKFSPDSTSLFLGGYTLSASNALDVNFMLAKVNLKNGGYIDNAFSDDGVITYRMAASEQNYLRALEIEPNGKMMLGGTITKTNAFWSVLKVLPNGAIDQSFGTAGRKLYNGLDGNSTINSFNLTGLHYNKTSKKYLLTGYYINPATTVTEGLVKQINYSGDADNSFGTSSEKTIRAGKDEATLIRHMEVRSDGKMIVEGSSQDTENGLHYLAMLNEDGSTDKTFGMINLSSLVNSFFLSKSIATSNVKIVDIKVQTDNANKILVAGHFVRSSGDGNYDVFILRLNANGTLDNNFSGSGAYLTDHSTGIDYKTQGIKLRSDGGIIWYGYFYNFFQDESNYFHALMQFNNNGARNENFAGSTGIHIYTTPVPSGSIDDFSKSMDVAVRSDNKIIVVSTKTNGDGNSDFLIFRVTSLGLTDTDFAVDNSGEVLADYGIDAYQEAASVALTADNRIVVGGRTSDEGSVNNAILMLTEKGAKDTTFADGGWAILNKWPGTEGEGISYVTVKDNKIIAVGYKFIYDPLLDSDRSHMSLMRYTLRGVLDNTFIDKGYTVVQNVYPYSSVVTNNKLYFAGSDRKTGGTTVFEGLAGRAVLGTGPVIKVTNLQASNYNKFLGDAPFVIENVTNSPAAKTYSISSNPGGCVTVNATTGLVSMSCATVNTGSVTVRVIQPAITGYTADTAFSTINVGKGIPKITFNAQGDTVGTDFYLEVQSNSDGYYYFNVSGGDIDSLYTYSNGQTYTYGEGCIQVLVSYDETDNYLSAYAYATVCAYEKLILPSAFDDQVSLVYPVQSSISLNPLANDEAYTGNLDPAGLDLDPATPGVQHLYISPALGKFEADTTTGVVTYTPFEGFLGEGYINYVVYDSKNSASPLAKIYVNVTAPAAEIPALKATELFTPNNDGLNDAFVIGNTVIGKENQLIIFDRNGQELFVKDNYNNDWYGELSNGKTAENGIYYYIFTERSSEQSRELKGVVELRR